MAQIQRTTSTGKTLTLCTSSPEEGSSSRLEEIREALRSAYEAAKDGEIAAICILGIPTKGYGMWFVSTVEGLGDLTILREELNDVCDEIRRGEDED